jgi:hypothetical protein
MRKLLLILLFATLSAEGQAPATFAEGVVAFEKKEWKAAEAAMRATIAGNPKESPGTVRVSGEWYETYVPHYFLARALAKQGKCAEAVKEFEETERQGVTMQIGDFARHVTSRGGCGGAPKAEPKKKIVLEATVPFGDEAPPPPPLTTTRAAPPPKPIVVTTTTAAPAPAPVPPRTVPAPAVDLDTRARLSAAIDAYLGGRYELATRILSESRFTDRAAAGEAALFRAAARHALYRSSGGQDAALRDLVASDLREYRALRPNARPDPRVFPPGFIALVR